MRKEKKRRDFLAVQDRRAITFSHLFLHSLLPDHMAMGRSLWLHFGVDEHPFATYFDVHQGYRVLTHSHVIFFGLVV